MNKQTTPKSKRAGVQEPSDDFNGRLGDTNLNFMQQALWSPFVKGN
jgi:hypothetical protein